MQELHVHVTCKSSRQKVQKTADGIKVWLQSAPEKGKANKELVEILSDALGCNVLLLSGSKSREKVVGVQCTQNGLEEKLRSIR